MRIKKLDKSIILNQNEKLASNGYRVIAIAYGKKDVFNEESCNLLIKSSTYSVLIDIPILNLSHLYQVD